MLKFNERTIEVLRGNTEYILLSDPVIRTLFDAMVYSWGNDKDTPYSGNFFYFVDIITDDFLIEHFETMEANDFTIREMTSAIMMVIINILKDNIFNEKEY